VLAIKEGNLAKNKVHIIDLDSTHRLLLKKNKGHMMLKSNPIHSNTRGARKSSQSLEFELKTPSDEGIELAEKFNQTKKNLRSHICTQPTDCN